MELEITVWQDYEQDIEILLTTMLAFANAAFSAEIDTLAWMASSDPVLVDDAKAVFEDIGGHEENVSAAKLALERASEHFPSKNW